MTAAADAADATLSTVTRRARSLVTGAMPSAQGFNRPVPGPAGAI